MEEKNNSRENLEKGKDNKTLIIVLVVLGIILLATIIFRIISKSLNNKNIYNKNNEIVDTDKDNNKNDSKDDNNDNEEVKNEENKLKTTRYEISENNLYVSRQEEKYKNYARDTKVRITGNVHNHDYYEYYIENNKLYVKNEVESKEVNLDGETPKYLAYGHDCGTQTIGCLTNEGNIYILNFGILSGDEEFKKIYSKGDVKELVIMEQSVLFTTCGDMSVLGLINNELYAVSLYDISRGAILREIDHPYSISERVNDIYASLIMYPDGSINKYLYNSSAEGHAYDDKIQTDYLEIDGKILKASYSFTADKKTYLIDTNGNLYEVINDEQFDGEKALLILKKSNIINEKIKYIEFLSESNDGFYDDFYNDYAKKQITLYGENGTKVEMIK